MTTHTIANFNEGDLGKPDSEELWAEIISHIPVDVLKNKKSRFLFPAIGFGSELIVLGRLLHNKYGWTLPQIKRACYGMDIRTQRVRPFWRSGFKNIIRQDFLEWETDMKFDVVLGNPPFQDSSSKAGNKLYTNFIERSFELLQPNGHLAFITPLGWMSYADPNVKRNSLTDGSMYKLIFRENQIVWMKLEGLSEQFNVGSSFSAYIIKKAPARCNSVVDGKKLNMIRKPFYPRMLNRTSMSILEKTMFNNQEKLDINQSNECHATPFNKNQEKPSKTKDRTHKYELYHTSADGSSRWSKVPHSVQFDKKVLMSLSGNLKPIYDDGQLGVTQIGIWIPVKNKTQGNRVVHLINSKLYRFLTSVTRYSGFYLTKTLKFLPAVPLTKKWTDEELYEYFNLTQEEIDLIETTIK